MSIVKYDHTHADLSGRVNPDLARNLMLERWVTHNGTPEDQRRRRRKLAAYYLSVDGWSYSQIADALYIDKATVCRYITSVRDDLQQYFREINFELSDIVDED